MSPRQLLVEIASKPPFLRHDGLIRLHYLIDRQ